jgi:hypothetical protein
MLELMPNCECCDADLPPEVEARICSYECTFCVPCAEDLLAGICPNCGGNLVPRPTRPPAALATHPGTTRRVFNPDCRRNLLRLRPAVDAEAGISSSYASPAGESA